MSPGVRNLRYYLGVVRGTAAQRGRDDTEQSSGLLAVKVIEFANHARFEPRQGKPSSVVIFEVCLVGRVINPFLRVLRPDSDPVQCPQSENVIPCCVLARIPATFCYDSCECVFVQSQDVRHDCLRIQMVVLVSMRVLAELDYQKLKYA